MKKSLVKLTIITVITSILGTALTACKKNEKKDTQNDTEGSIVKGAVARDQLKIGDEFKGKTLTIWGWWDTDDSFKADMASFQEKAGVTVDYQNIPWDQYKQKTITAVTSGAGPDIVYFDTEAVPTWIVKNILLPVSDNVDLTKPAFKNLSTRLTDFYAWNGKKYGLVDKGLGVYRLYYNKDLFKNNGLEDPLDIFKAGQWTWDKFFELGQELTQDTNGDGTMDLYAYDAWPVEQWLFTNGANYVNYVDGKPIFGLDDPKAITALQAMRDIKVDGKYKIQSPWDPNKDPQQKFVGGLTAMNYWGEWEINNMKAGLGDKLGMVPFPIGPDFKGRTADLVTSTAQGIAASSKDPKLAGLWMEFNRLPETVEIGKQKEEEANAKNLENYGSQELIDIHYDMYNNGIINPMAGFGDLSTVVDTILNKSNDKSPAQAVEANKQAAQAQIDEAMRSAQ